MLREKVNTLEPELLFCKEENEKLKEELKKKGQQADIVTVKGMDVGEKGDDANKRDADCGITERQFLTKKKKLESENMEVLLIERLLISKTKRKLLILDVNGLLLHIGNKFDLSSDCIADKFIYGKPLMLKELVKLWDKDDPNLPWEKREYNESNNLLVDDSPYKALLNPAHTTIFPTSYDFRNKNDNSLGHGGDIRMYLEGLVTSENVQKHIQQHPFGQPAITESHPCWQHYSQNRYTTKSKHLNSSFFIISNPSINLSGIIIFDREEMQIELVYIRSISEK
ncbi:hypothetical protein IFM89_002951 [Coptis chinensis]|uniref:Mitochondrial import inner membrane translocase subunit TIM50 n=1 Tax=Coptis chinensis TaxID=261450 RepID=A0A835MCQ7_9MAGN|nr:hypothetical protein IFM89_002951 [Coptis chinensis]